MQKHRIVDVARIEYLRLHAERDGAALVEVVVNDSVDVFALLVSMSIADYKRLYSEWRAAQRARAFAIN